MGTWLLLGVGILGVSTSGPLMAAAAASGLAIAFWRNAMASALLLPATAFHSKGLRTLDRRSFLGCTAAGVLLAVHFALWVPSVKLTTVATATALVCVQPVWTALLAAAGGRPVGRRMWVGIAVAVSGAVLITGADLTIDDPDAVLGDVMAIAGGAFAAAYVTVGERVRFRTSTTVYTTVCYTVCALTLLVGCLVAGVQLVGFDLRTWGLLAAVTICAQFLGHSVLNRLLDNFSATVLSVAILLEVPTAALLAFVFLGQRPPWLVLPGLVLLMAGLAVVVSKTRSPREAQPEV